MAKKTTKKAGLNAVKGLGPARIKTLEKNNISTIAKLASESPKSVAEKTGWSEKIAEKLVSAAKNAKTTTSTKRSRSKKTKKATKKKTTKRSSKKAKATKPKQAEDKAAKAAASAMKDIIARARDHFRKAPEEHVFYVRDGRTIQDLRELSEALEDMAEHVFEHHVNEDRHDFASWVHEVLQERALAEQLREAKKHPQGHQRVIYRHIVRRAW